MFRRWWAVVTNEFALLARTPLAWVMSGLVPCVVLIFFGFTLTSEMKNIPAGLYAEGKTPLTQKLVDLLKQRQIFSIREYDDELTLKDDIASGRLTVGIIVRKNFSIVEDKGEGRGGDGETGKSDSASGSKPSPGPQKKPVHGALFWAIVEGTDLFVAITAQARIAEVANELSRLISNEALQRWEALSPSWPIDQTLIAVLTDVWFNPNLEPKFFTVTHLVGILLTVTTLCLSVTSMVGEKESGSLSYIRLSSLRIYEVLCGKAVPYFVIGMGMLVFMLISAWLFFGIRPRGGFPHLLWLSAVYVLGCVMLAMTISCLSTSQRRAFEAATVLSIAMLLLSGLIFPVDQMPMWARGIAHADPLFHFNRILLGFIVRGQPVYSMIPSVLFLISFSAVSALSAFLMCRLRLSHEW